MTHLSDRKEPSGRNGLPPHEWFNCPWSGRLQHDRDCKEPQGEPSDASVRAALREWFQGIIAGGWTAEHEARMRAALRAAAGVR